jgi:hypothetical protein
MKARGIGSFLEKLHHTTALSFRKKYLSVKITLKTPAAYVIV